MELARKIGEAQSKRMLEVAGEAAELLWSYREMIPYLPLLFPYRLTSVLSNAIDAISTDPRV
jgi:hypothetical protein